MNTTVPPTVTLSAIIVVENQVGRVDRPTLTSSPTSPKTRNMLTKARNQRTPARAIEYERPEWREESPDADGAGREEAADERHRDRRGQQDVEQLDPKEPRHVAAAGEDRDRAHGQDQVQPGDQARGGAEGEVDRSPGERDREDQDGDADEERFAQSDLVAVQRIGADPRGAIEPWLGEPSECVHWPRAYRRTRSAVV